MLTNVDPSAWTHRYSPGNVARIQTTRPDASAIATYRQWREIGRQVRQGERGIRINLGRQRTCSVFDIAQTDPMRQCPCGTYADRADRFCAECGHQLTTEEKPAEPEPYTFTVSAKTLRDTLKPICAEIRKETTAKQRRDIPYAGSVRIQAKDYPQTSWTAAAFFDDANHLGPMPNPYAAFDVLLYMEDAYALATLIDPKKYVTLSTEEWIAYPGLRPDQYGYKKGTVLTVTQPSDSAGRTDTMRFKVLEA